MGSEDLLGHLYHQPGVLSASQLLRRTIPRPKITRDLRLIISILVSLDTFSNTDKLWDARVHAVSKHFGFLSPALLRFVLSHLPSWESGWLRESQTVKPKQTRMKHRDWRRRIQFSATQMRREHPFVFSRRRRRNKKKYSLYSLIGERHLLNSIPYAYCFILPWQLMLHHSYFFVCFLWESCGSKSL